jgi:hypothetical protein
MPDEESAAPPGAPGAEELLARVQELVDDRPVEGPCPIEWAVPAYFLGDMGALAAVSIRNEPDGAKY